MAAAPEDLLAASTALALLQAAHHLGNRHLPMEIQANEVLTEKVDPLPDAFPAAQA